MRQRFWLVALVMLVASVALGSSFTKPDVAPAGDRPIHTVVQAVGTAVPPVAHEVAASLGSTVRHSAASEHVVPCLERADCAGGFAGALLMAALAVSTVLATPNTPPLPGTAPVRVEHRPGRLVGGGLFRPPRTGS